MTGNLKTDRQTDRHSTVYPYTVTIKLTLTKVCLYKNNVWFAIPYGISLCKTL